MKSLMVYLNDGSEHLIFVGPINELLGGLKQAEIRLGHEMARESEFLEEQVVVANSEISIPKDILDNMN